MKFLISLFTVIYFSRVCMLFFKLNYLPLFLPIHSFALRKNHINDHKMKLEFPLVNEWDNISVWMIRKLIDVITLVHLWPSHLRQTKPFHWVQPSNWIKNTVSSCWSLQPNRMALITKNLFQTISPKSTIKLGHHIGQRCWIRSCSRNTERSPNLMDYKGIILNGS